MCQQMSPSGPLLRRISAGGVLKLARENSELERANIAERRRTGGGWLDLLPV
jgi:hypothetical protein